MHNFFCFCGEMIQYFSCKLCSAVAWYHQTLVKV